MLSVFYVLGAMLKFLSVHTAAATVTDSVHDAATSECFYSAAGEDYDF